MKNKYISSLEKAKQNFTDQIPRPGYPKGKLTWIRYKIKLNSSAYAFIKEFEQIEDNKKAKEALSGYLKGHQFSNHSFNVYLLDQLLKDFPDENWAAFNPNPIVFYQNIRLYVGCKITPEIVFKEGFKNQTPSKHLEAYVIENSGISTTKTEAIALASALLSAEKENETTSKEVYVYKIDYRGCEAVDLAETFLKRGDERAVLATTKKEVRIVGNINASDIISVSIYERNCNGNAKVGDQSNPNYDPDRKQEVNPQSNLIVISRDSVCIKQPESISSLSSGLR